MATTRAPVLGAKRLETEALVPVALAALLLAAGAFLWHQTRGTTLWFDEWQWVLYRRGNDVGTFLEPHNKHLSLVPIAIYRLLFATAGLDHYGAYRAMVITGHLGCVVLIFAYARRRVGGFVAILASSLVLFLGPAWSNILWPFQIAWLISLGAGLGALLSLDRTDRRGDAAACAFVAVSLASSGVGLPVALGIAGELLWGRRRLRDLWIVAAPLALYALWWLGYQADQTSHVRDGILDVPSFVINAEAGALTALVGLAGSTVPGDQPSRTLGVLLAVAAAGGLGWRLVALGRIPPRVLTLLTMLFAFWVVTAVNRAYLGPAAPYASHYRYVGGFLIVLLAVELLRGVSVPRPAGLVAAGVVALIVIANLGAFRAGGGYLREQATLTRAELGALDLARPVVKPGFVATGFPGYPFVVVAAGPYFAARDAYGSPAEPPAAIAADTGTARRAVDAELLRIPEVAVVPRSATAGRRRPPSVDLVRAGSVSPQSGCLVFSPSATAQDPAARELRIAVSTPSLVVTADGGPAAMGIRRFAGAFTPLPELRPGQPATVLVRRDLAPERWRLRIAPTARATVCALLS